MWGSRNRKMKGGGEDGTVPSNNDWALWMSGGEAQGCFLFLLVMVTSGALSPVTGKKKRSGWFCQRKGGCPRIMIQLQGRIQCQKRESSKAAVVFIKEVNEVASRLFVQYDMDYDMFFSDYVDMQ